MFFNAAVLKKKGKVIIDKLSLPKLKFGQSLVKIYYSSICHTQIQEIDGQRGIDNYLPHCLGHEGIGMVIDKHNSVKKVKNLDSVCLSWINSKGINSGGTSYLNSKGIKVNAGPVHTFSEYAVISENKIFKIDKVDKQKVLLGCALPTAYNVIDDLDISKINSICIIGCGGLGISCVIASKDYRIKKIFAVDKNKTKLKFAKKNGANETFESLEEIKNKQIRFDVIIECTGQIQVLKKCIGLSKNFGGKIIVIGNYPKGNFLKIDPWHIIQGKSLLGAWNDTLNFDKKFRKFEKKTKNKNLNFFFGDKIYKLTDINKAINEFKKGKIIRPLIKM